jgi:fluoroquinolone resistance protein
MFQGHFHVYLSPRDLFGYISELVGVTPGRSNVARSHRDCAMAIDQPAYRSISQDELIALAESSREFHEILFSPGTTFDDLDCTGCRFTRCLFQCPTFRGADFSEAEFRDCRFAPARFASCKFTGARFESSTFFNPEQKTGCTFAFCELRAVEMVKCNFSISSFERCDFYNLRAIESGFRGVDFHGSTFSRPISKKVILTKAKFDKCNFSFADMSNLSLQGCELLSCKFSETVLFGTDFSDAVMTGSMLDRAEWDRAKLSRADLRGAAISGLNLAVLSDYAGLTISESQQESILAQLGIKVSPD